MADLVGARPATRVMSIYEHDGCPQISATAGGHTLVISGHAVRRLEGACAHETITPRRDVPPHVLAAQTGTGRRLVCACCQNSALLGVPAGALGVFGVTPEALAQLAADYDVSPDCLYGMTPEGDVVVGLDLLPHLSRDRDMACALGLLFAQMNFVNPWVSAISNVVRMCLFSEAMSHRMVHITNHIADTEERMTRTAHTIEDGLRAEITAQHGLIANLQAQIDGLRATIGALQDILVQQADMLFVHGHPAATDQARRAARAHRVPADLADPFASVHAAEAAAAAASHSPTAL